MGTRPACPDKPASSGEGGWSKLVDALIEKVVPALATTVGLLGFVALIGGAANWVQLEAAQLPTSEALSLMSQDRLIPTGAASITGFLLIGAVAMFLVYGLDAGARQARAEASRTKPGKAGRLTAGASSGVVLVVGVELVAATWGLSQIISGIAASVVVILATALTLLWVSDAARSAPATATCRMARHPRRQATEGELEARESSVAAGRDAQDDPEATPARLLDRPPIRARRDRPDRLAGVRLQAVRARDRAVRDRARAGMPWGCAARSSSDSACACS